MARKKATRPEANKKPHAATGPLWSWEAYWSRANPRGHARHLREALQSFSLRPDKTQEAAESHIHTLACAYRGWTALAQAAPRIKGAFAKLGAIEATAGEAARTVSDLINLLDQMDDLLRDVLREWAGENSAFAERSGAFDREDEKGLPLGGRRRLLEAEKQLSQFSQAFGSVRGYFQQVLGVKDPDTPDRGGAGNLFTVRHGPSNALLAGHAILFFDEYSCDRPTTTDNGRFHKFLYSTQLYALGSDEIPNIRPHLRNAVRNWKTLCSDKSQLKKYKTAIAELASAPDEKASSDEVQARILELSKLKDSLSQSMADSLFALTGGLVLLPPRD